MAKALPPEQDDKLKKLNEEALERHKVSEDRNDAVVLNKRVKGNVNNRLS